MSERPLVSVVLPCLNEEEALGVCIDKIQRSFASANIDGEIIVCDNGSTDNSVAIAKTYGGSRRPSADTGIRQCLFEGVCQCERIIPDHGRCRRHL